MTGDSKVNRCKLPECIGKPRCKTCLAMDAAYTRPAGDVVAAVNRACSEALAGATADPNRGEWDDGYVEGVKACIAVVRAALAADEWRAMVYAPLDGTKVELLVRHRTWWTAHKLQHKDAPKWLAVCVGHWIDFNGGGWTWDGMSGELIGWRPLKAHDGSQA